MYFHPGHRQNSMERCALRSASRRRRYEKYSVLKVEVLMREFSVMEKQVYAKPIPSLTSTLSEQQEEGDSQ